MPAPSNLPAPQVVTHFWQQLAFWTAAASIIWNAVNTLRTESIQRRSRTQTIRLEEFRSQIREPISAALRQLDEMGDNLVAIRISAKTVDGKRQELRGQNALMVLHLGRLRDALTKANESNFADGEDWLEGFGDSEDKCLTLMDQAQNPTLSDGDLVPAIQKVCDALDELGRNATAKWEREIAKYLPKEGRWFSRRRGKRRTGGLHGRD